MTEIFDNFPARIHVLLARDVPFGVVIRRGPSQQVCTIGWNLEDDTFSLGQWLKGRIFARRSDLSPDGKHLIYFAANFGDAVGSWTAISQAPFLKATGFWPKGDAWHGGGLFIDPQTYWINDGFNPHQQTRRPLGLKRSTAFPYFKNYGGEDPGVYFVRLQRDNWRLVGSEKLSKNHDITCFEKRFDESWMLCKVFHATLDSPKGKGCYYDEHQLHNRTTGAVIDAALWEWADINRGRVMWAQQGKLYAGQLNDEGINDQKLLHDFNDMKFEAIAAPY